MRITQARDGSQQRLFVEGTLSDGWVEALETSWLVARSQSDGKPTRIDLSGVTYVDDRGRELLARMIRSGAELRATGIMTRAIIEEITEMIARDQHTRGRGATRRRRRKVMNKMIVTVFDDEKSAYEGLRAIVQLDAEGSLTLHAAAIVVKDVTGRVTVEQADDQGPAGTFFGLATGSLVGLLGGPTGMALGAATGTVAGSFYDLATLGVGEDFLTEVSQNLTPGRVAVVADADEEWVTPLDTRMETLGGVVFRRARGEFIDAQIEREAAADRAELAQLKAEYQQSVGEARANIKAKLDAAQTRIEARRALIKERVDAFEREGEARIKALQEQAAKAKGEQKAKLEQRVVEARADHKTRTEKLRQAWQFVKEAAAV